MDAIFEMTRTLANTRYEQLPEKAIDMTKKSILDTLAVTLAGSTVGAGCRELVELVHEGGGKAESSIVGFGGKVPAWMAAFANGAMSHSLDFDDVDDSAAVHPGVGTVPPGFAMAERIGSVSGKEFLTAVCLGADMLLRLGFAGKKGQGTFKWLPGQLYGSYGATAVCGRLLKLSEEQMVDAFGIALMQTSGSYEPIRGTGSVIRGLWPAFTSKTGVLSALMAHKGISGSKNSLEGDAALFQSYLGGVYDRAPLVEGLGERFLITESGFKPWPCSAIAKPYIEATLKLVQEHEIRPQDIEEVVVTVADMANLLCEPLPVRQNPQTPMDAKWSIPFAVGVAALRRKVTIGDFTPSGIQDAEVLRIARKVRARFDAQLAPAGRGWTGVPPGVVEIRTQKGCFSKRIDVALGYGSNPMSREQHVEKFKDCASYSAKKLSEADIDRVIDLIDHLEDVQDVGEIVRILA